MSQLSTLIQRFLKLSIALALVAAIGGGIYWVKSGYPTTDRTSTTYIQARDQFLEGQLRRYGKPASQLTPGERGALLENFRSWEEQRVPAEIGTSLRVKGAVGQGLFFGLSGAALGLPLSLMAPYARFPWGIPIVGLMGLAYGAWNGHQAPDARKAAEQREAGIRALARYDERIGEIVRGSGRIAPLDSREPLQEESERPQSPGRQPTRRPESTQTVGPARDPGPIGAEDIHIADPGRP